MLGLSCLLTTGFEALRETIALVRERSADWEYRLPVVIGGTAIDQHTAEYAAADGWCTDAADGIAVIATLCCERSSPEMERKRRPNAALPARSKTRR